MFFIRKSNMERLPVVMCGVRMGERALQIGIDEPSFAGTVSAKVGLSGYAAIAVNDDRSATKARGAAAAAGVLVDVQVTPMDSLPFPDESFDVILLHASADALPPLVGIAAVTLLCEGHRVLRVGGRIIVLERVPRRGVGAWFRSQQPPSHPSVATNALDSAGFRAARLLAEREGYRFTEGLK